MTFEKEFPHLNNKYLNTPLIRFKRYLQVEDTQLYVENNCDLSDIPINNKEEVKGICIPIEDIMQSCLDKQRVKDLLKSHLVEDTKCIDIHYYNYLMKKLGIE